MNDHVHDNAQVLPPDPRGWVALFVRRFFPPNWDKWPDPIPNAAHGLTTITKIRLDWKDRLRVLVSGRLTVEVMSVWEWHERWARSYPAMTLEPPAFTDRPEARA